MSCELCGRGDMWIKTCLTPEGSRLLVCDECYGEHASVLVIVPGDRVVMARCDHCWRYGNPREFVEVRPGGRKNAYSGTCWACAGRAAVL
jgi:ribosome-binding protein aMBF1 (putative translation factor)